jgi:glycosyltransferase involved in cell wall biosynthesis
MAGTFSFPEGGLGAGRALFMEAKGLARSGHDVVVVSCKGSTREDGATVSGVRLERFVFSGEDGKRTVSKSEWLYAQARMCVSLLGRVARRQYQSVIFYGPAPVFVPAAVFARLVGQHTAFILGDLFPRRERPILAWASRVLVSQVRLVIIGGSPQLEAGARRRAGAPCVIRLFPPTDTAFFGSGDAARGREALGIREGRIVAYAGAISRLEGIDVLVRAMALVKRRVPDAVLVVVGPVLERDPVSGPPVDYDGLVRSFELAGSVRFSGTLRSADVADALAAADVLVNPKIAHALNEAAAPIKIGEYLAAGRPVVTTRTCELDRWLVDRQDALFCEPGSAESLASAIEEVLTDPELADVLSKRGPVAAREVCDYRAWGRSVSEALTRTESVP